MKLVLVAGMSPRVKKLGPIVRLFEGRYTLRVENYKDCKLVLHAIESGDAIPIEPDKDFYSVGENFQLEVLSGSEDYINVFAEVANGSVPATTS